MDKYFRILQLDPEDAHLHEEYTISKLKQTAWIKTGYLRFKCIANSNIDDSYFPVGNESCFLSGKHFKTEPVTQKYVDYLNYKTK